ncbi:MAG: NUDIX domain-containing protein [Nitrospira sp.]|nr:NUDIX domain-containing protein [Nitrospira sp.]
MGKVQIEKKNRILDDFFKVEEVHFRYERFDGQMSPLVRRLNFERGDSVAVLLFNPKSRHILLVNQCKYPAYEKGPGWITETVAGMIEKNESPESAVRREVEEETGYNVGRLEHISTFYVSPGGSSERIILYYAEVDETNKIEAGGGIASEDEDIMTVELSLTDALKQIQSGQIADAKTIVGILWLHHRLTQDLTQSGQLSI